MSEPNRNPSLVTSHAQYARGMAEATIGQLSGSEAWKATGAQDKVTAMDHMKRAEQQREGENKGFGKPEEVAGKVVGCEGMKEEG
ncbi:hypothetical protein P152DRAFT_374446, partial [Eremomyces bilateralis CBS 781.70]